MSEIELNRATTTRLKIYEQQPFGSCEEVSRMRLSMQELLRRGSLLKAATAAP